MGHQIKGEKVIKDFDGNNAPEDFDIPSIGIEDIDRAVFELFDKTVAGHATEELLTRDLALQAGESISVQAGTANRFHIVASIQEFAIHRTPQSAL